MSLCEFENEFLKSFETLEQTPKKEKYRSRMNYMKLEIVFSKKTEDACAVKILREEMASICKTSVLSNLESHNSWKRVYREVLMNSKVDMNF